MTLFEQYENQLHLYNEMLKHLENPEYIEAVKKEIKKYKKLIIAFQSDDKFKSIFN